MDRLRVGVVGVGHLGKLHAALYKQVPEADLLGVFDVDQEKSREIAAELNITAFESLEALLDAVNAVNIVTPTTTHFEIAQQALHRKKHVFIEKPITHIEENARKLIETARDGNLLIQVGHIERFNPALLALEDVELDPQFIETHRLAPFAPRGTDVAVVLDLMIHDIDLILYLVKSDLVHIAASGVGVLSSNADIANARLEFKNGCVANITASRISAKKMRKMRIFQKNAYISMDFIEGQSEIFYIADKQKNPFHDGTLAISLGQIEQGSIKREIKYNRLSRKNVNPLKTELNSFVVAILDNLPPVVSASEGLAALKIAHQIMEKMDEHNRRSES